MGSPAATLEPRGTDRLHREMQCLALRKLWSGPASGLLLHMVTHPYRFSCLSSRSIICSKSTLSEPLSSLQNYFNRHFYFGHILGLWKFPGQGLNQCRSCNLHHSMAMPVFDQLGGRKKRKKTNASSKIAENRKRAKIPDILIFAT